MKSKALTDLKDEKKRNKRFTSIPLQVSNYNTKGRRNGACSNNGNNKKREKTNSPFQISGTDTLVFKPLSFPTIARRCNSDLSLDADEEKFCNVVDIELMLVFSDAGITIDRDENSLINIGKYIDIFYSKIENHYQSIIIEQDPYEEKIDIYSAYPFEINFEYCIVPINIIHPLSTVYPELIKLYISFLHNVSSHVPVLELSFPQQEWVYTAYDRILERLDDMITDEDADKETTAYYERAMWLYGHEGYVQKYEKQINEADNFFTLIDKFKPKSEIETILYNWLIKWKEVLLMPYSAGDFSYWPMDEESYPPITFPDACRFVWSWDDAYYEQFDDNMQISANESGIQDPTLRIEIESALTWQPSKEEEYLKKITQLLQEGREVYVDITEREDYVSYELIAKSNI